MVWRNLDGFPVNGGIESRWNMKNRNTSVLKISFSINKKSSFRLGLITQAAKQKQEPQLLQPQRSVSLNFLLNHLKPL